MAVPFAKATARRRGTSALHLAGGAHFFVELCFLEAFDQACVRKRSPART
jgi:hypothetical protein